MIPTTKIVARFQAADDLHNYIYTDAAFDFIFDERHVSDLDCFHPSAYGQKVLSDITWDAVVDDFENVCDYK